jgi:hypothetical protein
MIITDWDNRSAHNELAGGGGVDIFQQHYIAQIMPFFVRSNNASQ